MATLAELVVNLTANAQGFNKTFDDAKEKSASLGDHVSGIMGKIGVAIAGLGIGVAVGGFLKGAIEDASEAQNSLAQLNAVLKSTGGAAGITSGELTTLAGELQKTTKFSDESVQGAEAMLLTFTSIGKEVFPEATKTALDMSQALGQDLKSSSIQLGKALNDPILGVGALSRVGVQFTKDQKDMIKELVNSGDKMGAQKLILAELSKEFGGSAEAAGKTFAGQLAIAKNMLGELSEKIGGALLPILTPLIARFSELAVNAMPQVESALNTIIPLIIDGLGKAIAWATENIPKILATVQQVFTAIQPAIQVAITFITGTLIPAITTVVGFVVDNFPKIQATVKGVFDFLATNVFPIAKTEIGGVQSILKVVVDWVVENWPLIQATIARIMLAISNIIQVVMPVIRAIFETVFPIIVGVVKLAMSTILDVIKVIMQLITGDTSGALETLKGIFERIWNAIVGVINTVGALILAAVKKPIQDAIDWVNGITDKLKNIGAVMILSIRDGILSAPGAIRDALSGIVNGAITDIKNTLGIHSPSTVFKAIGANMMDGLEQGISSGTDIGALIASRITDVGALLTSRGTDIGALLASRSTDIGALLASRGTDIGALLASRGQGSSDSPGFSDSPSAGGAVTINQYFYGSQDMGGVRDGTMQGLRAAGLTVRPA